MPTANRQPRKRGKAKPRAAIITTIKLDAAVLDAIDALDDSGILGFPRQKPRTEKIRWLIRNFGECHARLVAAHAAATENGKRLDVLRGNIRPFITALGDCAMTSNACDAAPVDNADLQFYD